MNIQIEKFRANDLGGILIDYTINGVKKSEHYPAYDIVCRQGLEIKNNKIILESGDKKYPVNVEHFINYVMPDAKEEITEYLIFKQSQFIPSNQR